MSNLLDKASIILTPTAYNNGEALCVKPSDGSGDFDFSRNSAATRVNAQGLVENVQILSSNLVQNPSFSEEGVQEVSNGSFSQEGSELVTNGDFSNGSANWNLGASWSIVNEKAVNNGLSNSFLTQNSIVQNGKSYLVSFDIADMTQGSLQLRFGSGAIVTESFTSNGTKTSYYVSSGDAINFYSVSGFDGSIDNCSVREVAQDWTLGTGWSIGEDKAVATNVDGTFLVQNSILTSGKTYKINYTVQDYTSGSVRFRANSVNGTTNSGNGTYTDYIVSGGTQFALQGLSTFNGSVTNISVKEVGQNWDLVSANASIGENKLIANSVVTENIATQSGVVPISKPIILKFDLILNSGGFRVLAGSGGTATNITTSGTYTLYETSGTGGTLTLQSRFGGFDGSVTNISIIEISTDTNLPRINYENGCGSWLFEPQVNKCNNTI